MEEQWKLFILTLYDQGYLRLLKLLGKGLNSCPPPPPPKKKFGLIFIILGMCISPDGSHLFLLDFFHKITILTILQGFQFIVKK